MIKSLFSLVKIEHTLFALPLALTGAVLAARGFPDIRTLFLVAVAFSGARTAAMAFNRLADRHLDSANPRTTDREIPRGRVTTAQAWTMITVASLAYFFAAWALNGTCFLLSPIALAILLSYSYTKRFTWLCHFFLGLCLGIAPVAGWLAISDVLEWPPVVLGMGVLFWVAGFDTIYACQDVEFDRQAKVYSFPSLFGMKRALTLAAAAHVTAACLFVLSGSLAHLGWPFYVLSLITCALLLWEHILVRPGDSSRLNLAFFQVNSLVSFSLLAAVWSGIS
ncbi:MAG TPA: UbiA-like polyprenyltransferase [Desulfomonilaceae bacterium]|nr:UbiA-like polyprenyltransferase [Desulfomonilaceae bacterium]